MTYVFAMIKSPCNDSDCFFCYSVFLKLVIFKLTFDIIHLWCAAHVGVLSKFQNKLNVLLKPLSNVLFFIFLIRSSNLIYIFKNFGKKSQLHCRLTKWPQYFFLFILLSICTGLYRYLQANFAKNNQNISWKIILNNLNFRLSTGNIWKKLLWWLSRWILQFVL